MTGKTISHYKILEKLGSGSMGDVYKAEDTKLKRTVALKFLPPELTRDDEARERFVREAQASSSLDHSNIGTIYEIEESDGHFFIAMAYYAGETLKEKIKSCKSGMDVEQAIDIAIQIARGLKRAHSKNIIHRDIKPANIILTNEGQVKIIDFGLAKLKGQTLLTKTGSTLGTVAYMSPEQTQGDNVDHQSDIWSLGVILYEMLAGERPFKGDYEQAVMFSIMNEEPEFITKIRKEVPGKIERILKKAIAKNPKKRYQTIEAMLEALKNVVEEIKEGRSEKPFWFKLGRKQRRFVYRTAAVILVLISIGFYLWQTELSKVTPVSIALLPLKGLTNDAEQEWFTDSMTEALITDLAKISGLRVISSSSAMKYKGTEKTPPEIATELGIQYIIEGSIVKMDEQVKISARLIDASKDEYLWAEEYERAFVNILGLQGEIAQAIAGQVQVKLTALEETRLAVSRSINPVTYEMYLKGMYHLNKYTPEGIEKGLDYLHQAVENDPEEPLAHAGLAIGYGLYAHTPAPPPFVISRARTAAQKALELDDNIAEVYLALGMISAYRDWDIENAGKFYNRALELNPSLALAHGHHAFCLLIFADEDAALAEGKRAQELDPLVPIYPAWQGWTYYWLERNDEAIKEALKSLELVPDFPIGLYVLGCAYAAKGMYDEAIEVQQKAGAISLDYKWGLGQTYALTERRDEALAVAAELEGQLNVWHTWGLAEIYTALGDKDKTFYWLEEGYKQRHAYMPWLKKNPCFNPLHNDPRFEDLAKRLNLPE